MIKAFKFHISEKPSQAATSTKMLSQKLTKAAESVGSSLKTGFRIFSQLTTGPREDEMIAFRGSAYTGTLILVSILLLAALIRGFNISRLPSLNPDEAALGYNAFSLIQTGKDEHGASWPLHFKSFGDFKPGGYVYLALPFVKLFGLTVLAVRLPNLILSVLTIYFLFLIVRLLTKNTPLAMLSCLVLTLSPWHIHFSRGAWESSAALAFVVIGTYFFFKAVNSKTNPTRSLLLFVLFYALSLYVYHSARLVAPLLGLSLFITNFSFILKQRTKFFLPLLFGVLISLPVAFSFLHSGGAARFGGVGLTADTGPVWRANELLNQDGAPGLQNRLFHNKKLLYVVSWAQKYSSHFDFNFLFINGDEVPRSRSPEMGQLYLLELPLLLIGLITLLKTSLFHSKSKIFILAWLLAAPVASSLTFQAPSALRALPLVIPLSVLVGLGLYQTLRSFSRFSRPFKFLSYFLLFTFYLLHITYYLDSYFVHAPKRYPFAWNTGFDQLSVYLKTLSFQPTKIYITDKYDQPYILMLFFDRYPPQTLQKEIKLTPPDKFGFSTVSNFGPYVFGRIDWENIPAGSLVVAADESVPAAPIHTINFPNGYPGFTIYTK